MWTVTDINDHIFEHLVLKLREINTTIFLFIHVLWNNDETNMIHLLISQFKHAFYILPMNMIVFFFLEHFLYLVCCH